MAPSVPPVAMQVPAAEEWDQAGHSALQVAHTLLWAGTPAQPGKKTSTQVLGRTTPCSAPSSVQQACLLV